MKIYFISLISLCLFYQGFSQSGWTKPKGEFFGKLDFSSLSSEKYYNPSGLKINTNNFTQRSLNWYGEYGITDKLTFITAMPLLRINAFETTEPVTGVGDLKVELKYQLKSQGLPISISIAPEIPTGRSNAFSQSKTEPLERINLPTGDGEFNVWSTLAISKSIGKAYGSIYGAYNYRTKYEGLAFRDLYAFGLEFGLSPIKDLWVNAKTKAQFSTGDCEHPELGFVRGDATTYTLFSFEVYYKVTKNIGFSATYLTGTSFISPFRNIYIAPYFSVGVIYENKK